jgi:hypothetical protein
MSEGHFSHLFCHYNDMQVLHEANNQASQDLSEAQRLKIQSLILTRKAAWVEISIYEENCPIEPP